MAELSKALFSGVNAPAALSALCHWGFDSCASFELERWREFILKDKKAGRRVETLVPRLSFAGHCVSPGTRLSDFTLLYGNTTAILP